jgi:hypothetical protein
MQDANYFLEKADECFGLSEMAGANRELAAALQSMGNEFMAKAVEIDTKRDRDNQAANEKEDKKR